jgi:hypothetical protein
LLARGFDSFQRQFLLTQRDGPSCFLAEQLGTWTLYRHPTLPCVRALDPSGRQIGWLLGEAIDEDFLTTEVRLDPARLAAVARRWHGWFLLVLPELDIVLTDCAARLPCFYDSRTGCIASSPALIMGIEAYLDALDRDLLNAVDIDGMGWLPFGLTAVPQVRRVPPSHRLRLSDLAVERYWPTAPIKIGDASALSLAIAERLKRVIHTIARDAGAMLPLTAGQDSRLILALTGDLEVVAMTLSHGLSQNDVAVAARLAAIAGIPHQIRPVLASTEEERQAWLLRTGHVVGGRNPRQFRSQQSTAPGVPVLTGLGGEVTRGFYWKRTDKPEARINAPSLLGRLGMPQRPLLVDAADKWLSTVADFDLMTQLDLAYIEQRLGCWGASSQFGPDFVYRDFCPLIDPVVFDLTLALPHEFRRRRSLATAIIAQARPELLAVPINRPPPLARIRAFARKVADPERIRRKVRQLLAE